MDSVSQRTVAEPSVCFKGIGLHCGKLISMRLLPAPIDAGIVFVRSDLNPVAKVRARAANVTDTTLSTTLEDGLASVGTVEHLLSAFCACGVDNVIVEIDGPEVPIMDGSAQPFITLLHDCGLVEQPAAKKFYQVQREVKVSMNNGRRKAALLPATCPCWELRINFSEQVIRTTQQFVVFEFTSQQSYVANIARARTFGFVRDLKQMLSSRRALGGSLENALVLTDKRVLNAEGLRQTNEFAAHKLLDAMGDCFIDGYLIIGRYVGELPGHELNNLLIRALLDDPDAYEVKTSTLGMPGMPDFGVLQGAPLVV